MIDAGRARSLAIMAPARNPQFPDVPTLNESLGIDYTIGAWRGIAGPKGLPQPIVDDRDGTNLTFSSQILMALFLR